MFMYTYMERISSCILERRVVINAKYAILGNFLCEDSHSNETELINSLILFPEMCVGTLDIVKHIVWTYCLKNTVPDIRLTHWGRMTHICVSKLTIIGSDKGLSPDRRQAIIWTYAGILSIGPLGTKLSEILIAINIFSFKKMHLNMSSAKRQPFCLGLNELIANQQPFRYKDSVLNR